MDLPPNFVASVGLDDSTKTPYGKDTGLASEFGCRWNDTPRAFHQRVNIGRGSYAVEDDFQNPLFLQQQRINVVGRQAVQFRQNLSSGDCVIAMSLPPGTAVIAVSNSTRSSTAPAIDSCPDAMRIATALSPILPN